MIKTVHKKPAGPKIQHFDDMPIYSVFETTVGEFAGRVYVKISKEYYINSDTNQTISKYVASKVFLSNLFLSDSEVVFFN